MQHAVFHTIAFLAFSCLAFSTLAIWCRKFMSRIFSVPVVDPGASHHMHHLYGRHWLNLPHVISAAVLHVIAYVRSSKTKLI